MFTVYILYSENVSQYYVGHTNNLEERLLRHNSGRSKSTKKGKPWKVMHTEEFYTRSEAMLREKEIKQMKSRIYIEDLVKK